MNDKAHWEAIYQAKPRDQVSWYQAHANTSLRLIQATGFDKAAQLVDVGGGASTLVDDLLDAGFTQVTVLDIAAGALQAARERLGPRAAGVTWIEADLAEAHWPHHFYDVWHDRAVFHFLTRPEERQRYAAALRHALKPGGYAVIATFALDGPQECSGLPTVRYGPDSLRNELGDAFAVVNSTLETHVTPWGTEQRFVYCVCRRAADAR